MARALTSENLIANQSIETLTIGQPGGWKKEKWGSSTALQNVKSPGLDGNNSLYSEITKYNSGTVRWFFEPVSVQPSTTYSYSTYYKSNVRTDALAVIKTNGGYVYRWLGFIRASPTNFTKYSAAITMPSNATSLTVYQKFE